MSAELASLAAQILAWERENVRGEASSERAPIELALERLRAVMSMLVGTGGFEAILRRALHLAKQQHAWLVHVEVAKPLPLRQLTVQSALAGEPHAMEGSVALLATVLHLFCSFIREDVTLMQVRRCWSELPPGAGRAASSKETE